MRQRSLATAIGAAFERLSEAVCAWASRFDGPRPAFAGVPFAGDVSSRPGMAMASVATSPRAPALRGPVASDSGLLRGTSLEDGVAERIRTVRAAQAGWGSRPLRDRLGVLRRLRLAVVANPRHLADAVPRDNLAETLAAEILPLLDACRFLEHEAHAVLKPRTLSTGSRPMWLRGNGVTLRRDPLGAVLIVGPSNYPLMLPGVQILQAVTAGNGVLVKPAPGCSRPIEMLVGLMESAGLPPGVVQLLPESPEAATAAIHGGVDKVFLTGSAPAGRAVSRDLAEGTVPCVMELSGCDAVFVLDDADPELVSDSLLFGLTLNGSRTCMAPRRVFASPAMVERVLGRLQDKLRLRSTDLSRRLLDEKGAKGAGEAVRDALRSGAQLAAGTFDADTPRPLLREPVVLDHVTSDMTVARSDLFAPVLSFLRVSSEDEALRENERCPYALSATVFGSERRCRQMAERIPAGCVVLNDMIVPTADPRVPFGGRGTSGHGVTRGAAGLEAMTHLKAIVATRRWFKPHLETPTSADADVLEQLIRLEHAASPLERLAAVPRMIRATLAQFRIRRALSRPSQEGPRS